MATRHGHIGCLKSHGYLDGQFLIAMPSTTDSRFHRSVIYVCAHSEEGAMGLIVNQRASHITMPKLLEQLDIPMSWSRPTSIRMDAMAVHLGGPIDISRGFVLHSSDYFVADATLPINGGVCLTATVDILRAIARGRGPNNAILALGYAGWEPGQLEREIQENGWLNCPADPAIIFDSDLDTKYHRAMESIGIDPSHLVCAAGRA
ncbi:protein of unknown function DUF179 [Rhodomicrobium vannielii ATCC 17100]|uniref:UPF0301 protein Rvan_1728 n=1 Tax=Rhodomicrobium vannielii (strain ATCC 17100 / DSM 162 / LMG 4299 / NCIMB 10020 / ATH 3.1.1) TaxID=648757 RepID=E3HZ00_RHOVT|nr:YqgE/AlgH family protein [Rhodomicrobium vannielii]ADP70975.1 protein of unknown function DUF179 [Rhodomicrobium vannielii ATCC 17100]